jgi:hypothetical protein
MDQAGEPGQNAGVSIREDPVIRGDAMSEIEGVALGGAATIQDLPRPLLDDLPGREQESRVFIAYQVSSSIYARIGCI